jgi:hypothetical protein
VRSVVESLVSFGTTPGKQHCAQAGATNNFAVAKREIANG